MDFKAWFAQDRLVHRVLLLTMVIVVAAFRQSVWRDLLLYGSLLLLGMHLEFRHAVVTHFLRSVRDARPREPDARDASPPGSRTYN